MRYRGIQIKLEIPVQKIQTPIYGEDMDSIHHCCKKNTVMLAKKKFHFTFKIRNFFFLISFNCVIYGIRMEANQNLLVMSLTIPKKKQFANSLICGGFNFSFLRNSDSLYILHVTRTCTNMHHRMP